MSVRRPSSSLVAVTRPAESYSMRDVAWGSPADPYRTRLRVARPQATIAAVKTGTVVSVKAVNARGLEGWDWARVEIK